MKKLKHLFAIPVVFLLLLVTPAVAADDWVVVSDESSIRFTGTQTGEAFSGVFKRFETDISYDPDNPADARVRAVVDLASVSTGDTQRDTALPTKDWFFVSSFPQATFEAVGFQLIGGNLFNVTGKLSLRGLEQNITLPIDLKVEGSRAAMQTTFTLKRADFGVGTGPWAEGKWVGLDVIITLNIIAERRMP